MNPQQLFNNDQSSAPTHSSLTILGANSQSLSTQPHQQAHQQVQPTPSHVPSLQPQHNMMPHMSAAFPQLKYSTQLPNSMAPTKHHAPPAHMAPPPPPMAAHQVAAVAVANASAKAAAQARPTTVVPKQRKKPVPAGATIKDTESPQRDVALTPSSATNNVINDAQQQLSQQVQQQQQQQLTPAQELLMGEVRLSTLPQLFGVDCATTFSFRMLL